MWGEVVAEGTEASKKDEEVSGDWARQAGGLLLLPAVLAGQDRREGRAGRGEACRARAGGRGGPGN